MLGQLLGSMLGDGYQYIDQGKHAQEQSAILHLLSEAGPGHMVVGVRWKERHGWKTVAHKAFPNDTPREEIEAWKREAGWPGHAGTSWDWFKEDVRRFWDKLLPYRPRA